MATADQHREISAQFLAHAEDEFRKGDLLQASEKAWGAVAHFINSIARDHGWPVGSHKLLIENATTLLARDETNAVHRRRLLRTVEALHSNFYQAAWDQQMVRDAIDDATELIGAMTELSTNSL